MEAKDILLQSQPPDDEQIASALGPAQPAWNLLMARLRERFGPLTPEWKVYSKKAGWTLRLLAESTALVYRRPHAAHFAASVVLGEGAMERLRTDGFPHAVIQAALNARRYAEGTTVTIEVRTTDEADVLARLVALKEATSRRASSDRRPRRRAAAH
jgi:hypothetical protein